MSVASLSQLYTLLLPEHTHMPVRMLGILIEAHPTNFEKLKKNRGKHLMYGIQLRFLSQLEHYSSNIFTLFLAIFERFSNSMPTR
jgi:hypothetical protein